MAKLKILNNLLSENKPFTMNTPFRFILLILTTTILSQNLCFGQISESFAYPADDMFLSTDTTNGVVYCNVLYADTYNNGETAQPSLPVKYYTFSVPYNATNLSVSADILDTNIISAPAVVFPMQAPQPTNGTETDDFTLPDNTIYNTNAYFPSNITKIVDEGYYLGDNHVVTVAVYPIQYNPVANSLKVNNEIYLNISYTLANNNNLPTSIVSRDNMDLRNEGINHTKSFVFNPSSVESFAKPYTQSIAPYTVEPLPMYQYCIVTSRELAPAFERLVALKKQKGYDAGVVCMEDILACDNYKPENLTSEIKDNAGSLRTYLKDAFKYGTEYVLLGGKEPHVPIRSAYNGSGTENTSITNIIPTDLYFADITGNWNFDKDPYYGETTGDKIDYNPELIVGRLLCKNIEEVNNYIDKILIYELNPGNGDYSYLENSFFTFSKSLICPDSSFNCPINNNKHNAIDYMICSSSPIFDNITTVSQNGNYPSGCEIISFLNSNPQGYISFHGHGNPNNVGLTDKSSSYQCDVPHAICALDNECYYVENTIGDGLDCMTNKYFPNISYSISCTLMPYDIYSEKGIPYDVTYNFGESYTLGKNYGGVAFLGNTRNGWTISSTELESEFLKQIYHGVYCVGKAEAESKKAYKNSNYIRLAHNLLGDPSIDIWTDIPVKYTDADIDILRNDQGIIVSGSCLDGAKIVVHDTNGGFLSKIGSANNGTYFSNSPNSHVVIYRHNMIPYFAPICIQNETINSSQYLFANTVNIGMNADSNRTSGYVIFDSNANWTIEASGNVILGSGLILNPGASLTIKTQGNITISGCNIKPGASLILEGKGIELGTNFNAESNSIFKFNILKD